MTNKIFILLIIALLAITSCGQSSQKGRQESAKTDTTTTYATAKGKLVMGHEANVFTPCDSKIEYWIVDKTGRLQHEYDSLTKGTEPYTPVFAEIKFADKGKSSEGFAAEYSSVYEVVEVIAIRHLTKNDCPHQ